MFKKGKTVSKVMLPVVDTTEKWGHLKQQCVYRIFSWIAYLINIQREKGQGMAQENCESDFED